MKPKEPPKQEPKREWIFITIVLCVLIGTNFGLAAINGWVISKVEETNRLLSTFQRTDTVKDEKPLAWTTTSQLSLCSCDGTYDDCRKNCEGKVGHIEKTNQSDPNICYHWDSDCKSKAGGWSECTTVCHMQPEP